MFKGSITALITPFRDGRVDAKAYQDLVAWQLAEGTDAVVPCGTTGESPTLTHEEHHRVVELCLEVAKGKVPVIAGTGSNSTDEAIDLTRHAQKAGADAALVVAPYYNKPTQEHLYRHFKDIHDATDIPILLYNVPGRTVVEIAVDTVARLAKLPRIVGIKDATSDINRPTLMRIACGDDFCLISGEDGTALPFLAAGGVGCISVTANIAPRLCADMQRAWREGDVKKAQAIHTRLAPVHAAMFCESSPGPVKHAASLLGKCAADCRPPLYGISDASRKKVEDALRQAGILG